MTGTRMSMSGPIVRANELVERRFPAAHLHFLDTTSAEERRQYQGTWETLDTAMVVWKRASALYDQASHLPKVPRDADYPTRSHPVLTHLVLTAPACIGATARTFHAADKSLRQLWRAAQRRYPWIPDCPSPAQQKAGGQIRSYHERELLASCPAALAEAGDHPLARLRVWS
jgi:hypothetical protein